MVHKAVPITIVVLVVLALGLGYFFLFYGSIDVGEPFTIQYEDCLSVLDVKGQFISAMNADDPGRCTGMEAERFCMGVVSRDPSLCDGDASCLAIVNNDADQCPEDDFDCRALILGSNEPCAGHLPFEIDSYGECQAFASKDVRYFSSTQAKQNCIDAVVYQASNVSSECEQISHADLRAHCFEKFS